MLLKVAKAGADMIMLDNFSIEQVKDAVRFAEEGGLFGQSDFGGKRWNYG